MRRLTSYLSIFLLLVLASSFSIDLGMGPRNGTTDVSSPLPLGALANYPLPVFQIMGRNVSCDYTTYHVGTRILSIHAGRFVIQGTNASDVIQRTLNQLANGGTECLASGTYELDHGLVIAKSYVNFLGQGNNTLLTFSRASNEDNLLTVGLGATRPIDTPTVSGAVRNVTVANLMFDGEKSYADSALSGGDGFEVRNMGIWILGAEFTNILDVSVRNVGQYCITFRSTGPDFVPSSTLAQASLYNEVRDSHLFNCRTGIFIDGVLQAPSSTMGRGNRVIGNTIIEDWASLNIDVPGNSQGFGIVDFGNEGTVIANNLVEGYTPNPSIPSHTSYAGYLIDGNSSALLSNNAAEKSYFGISFGLTGAASSSSFQTSISGFETREVRYSIGVDGITSGFSASNIAFTDPMDPVNRLSGVGLWIGSIVKQISVRNLQGEKDGSFFVDGTSGLLQIVGGIGGIGAVQVEGGAQNNLDFDFIVASYPNSLTIRDVVGYDPVGTIGNPFSDGPDWISPFGDTSTPIPSTDYAVNGSDVYLTATGGIGVSITVRDSSGNVLASPGGEVAGYAVEQGSMVDFGAFTEPPFVTVSGN